MTAVHRWTLTILLFSTTTLWAQQSTNGPADPPSNADQSPSGRTPAQPPGPSTRPSRGSDAIPGNRGNLDVEQGSIPKLFSQDKNNGNQAVQQGPGQPKGGKKQTAGGQRQFIQNALRFDANADRQLAANELANLFHVLASSQQRTIVGTSVQSSQISGGQQPFQNVTGNNISNQADAVAFIQRDSVRQALFLFLQLTLQFDANGDGLLSQPELFNLARALLQNNMGLLNAATQSTGGQRQTTSTNANRANTTTNGTVRNNTLIQTNGQPQSRQRRDNNVNSGDRNGRGDGGRPRGSGRPNDSGPSERDDRRPARPERNPALAPNGGQTQNVNATPGT